MYNDDGTLQFGVHKPVTLAVVIDVVDKSQVIVLAGWVFDPEVRDLSITESREAIGNDISGVLLGGRKNRKSSSDCGGQGEAHVD